MAPERRSCPSSGSAERRCQTTGNDSWRASHAAGINGESLKWTSSKCVRRSVRRNWRAWLGSRTSSRANRSLLRPYDLRTGGQELADGALPREPRSLRECLPAEFVRKRTILGKAAHRLGEPVDVVRVEQDAGLADDLRERGAVGRDHGRSAGECLERLHAEPFVQRGVD